MGQISSCVITVPVYFTVSQRQAIIDSAALAGLNVLSLINQGTSLALQYGIHSPSAINNQNVLFFDAGENLLEMTLVTYKQISKKDPVSILVTGSPVWSTTITGREMDRRLFEHVAVHILEKHQYDIKDKKNSKDAVKLSRAVQRTKHVLSVNTEADCEVRGLNGGAFDFQTRL